MSISFECPQCGKKLKAPGSAAGKSSSCPGCGIKVTCPEPVYDAEVVEMELARAKPKGFDPFADVDDDKPYGVMGPPPEGSSSDENRPCPMCGEMIVATAAKCRYCDEVFDETIKRSGKAKSGKGKKKAILRSIARVSAISPDLHLDPNPGLDRVFHVYSHGAQGGSQQLIGSNPRDHRSVFSCLDGRWSGCDGLRVHAHDEAFECLGGHTCASSTESGAVGGLIALLVINGIATNRLRNSGISVGFFGADMSDF